MFGPLVTVIKIYSSLVREEVITPFVLKNVGFLGG